MSLSKEQLLTSAAVGVAAWFLGTYLVKKGNELGVFDNDKVAATYVATVPVSFALAEIVQRVARTDNAGAVTAATTGCAAALALDAVGITWAPNAVYGGNHANLAKPAAWLMFGVTGSLTYALAKAHFTNNDAARWICTSSSAMQQQSHGTTHFGFQTVDENEKEHMVKDVFRKVAERYDIMNDVMSGTIHRYWKDEFVKRIGVIASTDGKKATVLDVAGGTGDIAFRIVDSINRSWWKPATAPEVIVCDINEHMLAVGHERAKQRGYLGSQKESEPKLRFLQGNAEQLPIESNSIDLYTIAFGIRNVTHVDAALREAYRVLKPGGRFMCLEFSQVENPLLRQAYDMYSFNVIPTMGQVVANDRASYQYLVESIRKFPDQTTFANMIRDAGFDNVEYTNYSFGVCALHSGFKWRTSQKTPQTTTPLT